LKAPHLTRRIRCQTPIHKRGHYVTVSDNPTDFFVLWIMKNEKSVIKMLRLANKYDVRIAPQVVAIFPARRHSPAAPGFAYV
jgi:hypothetical protein